MGVIQGLQTRIGRIRGFLSHDLWRLEVTLMPSYQRIAIHLLRILCVVLKQLSGERVHLRAAGLTFYSLLSIVPVLAMLFGLAKGFGLDRVLEKELFRSIGGQEEVVTRLIAFAHNLLETTQGGIVAGAGVVVLFWSVLNVFGSIEKGFNEMWGITQQRPLLRKATHYLSLSLCSAILVAISSAMTVMITSQVTFFVNRIKLLETFSPAIFEGLKALPMMVIWLLFTLIYSAIPNTRVRIGPAALAGVLAGTAFQVFQRVYIGFQVGVAKYNAIYGSFAALPLFLVWMQLSWLIVLIGAQISVVTQNLDRFAFEADSRRISPAFRRLLTLLVASQVVKQFCFGEGAAGMLSLASQLRIPRPLLQDLLGDLVACGVLVEIRGDSDGDPRYQPGTDPDRITVHYVLARLEANGGDDLPVEHSGDFLKLSQSMEKFRESVQSSPANLLLKQL
ncbi:MAG TPA: YihY/virulence factor BrkB family protein [Syntrophobacteraceae bacterium]|nr:YihY/virulence factor BrkB family protein [Syntrophobacteraceae bacterium]